MERTIAEEQWPFGVRASQVLWQLHLAGLNNNPGAALGGQRGEHQWVFSRETGPFHGAATTTAMTHLATQDPLDGKFVDCMEGVTDDQ
jgi:hypothetical protein